MSKGDSIETEGVVVEALANMQFRVKLTNGMVIIAYVKGRVRKNNIRITPGDSVSVELSPYDLTRGRIAFRK